MKKYIFENTPVVRPFLNMSDHMFINYYMVLFSHFESLCIYLKKKYIDESFPGIITGCKYIIIINPYIEKLHKKIDYKIA